MGCWYFLLSHLREKFSTLFVMSCIVEPPKDVEFLTLTSTTHECDLIWK